MPGVKGKSGGQRDGAGRPVQKLTIHVGQTWYYNDGGPGVLATVTSVKRNKLTITLGDGREIEMIK